MPLMNTPFQPGTCVAAVRAMEAGPRRDIAWAEYCCFTGQPDKAARAAGAFVMATSTVLLHRCAQHQGYDVSIGEDTNILSYADAFDVSGYAVSALQRACGAGIISGTGDGSTLTPQARPPARRRRRCGCGSVNRTIDQASAMPGRRNCGERMSRHPKTGRGLRDKSSNLAGL